MNPLTERQGSNKFKEGELNFDETWHAEILGIAEMLIQKGRTTREKWADTLGVELKVAKQSRRPDNTNTYYECVLQSVEIILTEQRDITQNEISIRQEEWRSAYVHTPHGQPVNLE